MQLKEIILLHNNILLFNSGSLSLKKIYKAR